MFYIYLFTNKINKKYYVGKTNDPKRRYNEHKCGQGNAVALLNAIKKYGIDNFDFIVIDEYCTEEECLNEEKRYITIYNSNNRRYGYNLTEGGEGISGWKHSEETKKKMSENRKGPLSPNYGKTIPDWHKEILSKTHKGKKLSEDHINMMKSKCGENSPLFGIPKTEKHKENMKASAKRGPDNHMFGTSMPEETRLKISIANTGKKRSEEAAVKLNGKNHWAFGLKGKDNPNFGKSNPKASKMFKGEGNPMAKLTENDVRSIKKYIFDGYKNKDIMKIMNISSEQVSKIKSGKRWKHIKI